MAKSIRDQLFELYGQGYLPRSTEAKAIAPNSKTRYNRFYEFKKQLEDEGRELPDPIDGDTFQGSKVPATLKDKKPTLGTPGGGPITVGRITITPENWGMTQEGAILIIDTYNKAKRDIDYDGTIGEFICDVMKVYRRIQNYEEVQYGGNGRPGEGGQGSKTHDESGTKSRILF